MINTFLYSVFGQAGVARHIDDVAISEYRNRWMNAVLVNNPGLQAVVTLGKLADIAYRAWQASPGRAALSHTYATMIHPTFPESASASGSTTKALVMRKLCDSWNTALTALYPHDHSRRSTVAQTLGAKLVLEDLTAIPEADLPAGLPPWMRSLEAWARRDSGIPNELADQKRATLLIQLPAEARDWPPLNP